MLQRRNAEATGNGLFSGSDQKEARGAVTEPSRGQAAIRMGWQREGVGTPGERSWFVQKQKQECISIGEKERFIVKKKGLGIQQEMSAEEKTGKHLHYRLWKHPSHETRDGQAMLMVRTDFPTTFCWEKPCSEQTLELMNTKSESFPYDQHG